MVRKLTHAQKVFEALAREDYPQLRTHADGLAECVKDATWRINDSERYLMSSTDFSRGVASLQKAAKDKKGDAATLAFIDMTLTCVKCHRYLRDEGITRLPDIAPPAPAALRRTRRSRNPAGVPGQRLPDAETCRNRCEAARRSRRGRLGRGLCA
jgi:hypothetical protein